MEIVFPTSSSPSINPTENGGRLINAYAEKAPDGSRSKVIIRRSPGLDFAFTAGEDSPRGMKLVGSVLYIVNGDTLYATTKAGLVYSTTPLGGTVSGTGPVIIAHNMKAPTADVLIHTSAGIDKIDTGSVVSFSDADLPSTNSLTFMDSYFFFTTAAGRCTSAQVMTAQAVARWVSWCGLSAPRARLWPWQAGEAISRSCARRCRVRATARPAFSAAIN